MEKSKTLSAITRFFKTGGRYARVKNTYLAARLKSRHFVVCLAYGIQAGKDSDLFKYLKTSIEARLSKNGDSVTFLEVFPYGYKSEKTLLRQVKEVGWDAYLGNSEGGRAVLEGIEGFDISSESKLVLIGHSGGGVAVRDAYEQMPPELQRRVTQVVTVGSPKVPINKGADCAAFICDEDDPIAWIGHFRGKEPKYLVKVRNMVTKPVLQAHSTWNFFSDPHKSVTSRIDEINRMINYGTAVHISYFSTPKRADGILFQFYDRAFGKDV